MRVFNKPVRSSTYYKHAFERLFRFLALNSKHVRLMVEAETTTFRFLRTLMAEEAGRQVCTPDQASYEGEQILALLNRLFFLLEENLENHRLLINLAVSTGVWIADRQGEIKELELIVSGIATFANLTADRQELEELYEISLKIMHAADGFLKADIHKQSPRCPWRLLCLNHCIIATRTDNGDLARRAYDRLIEYLPEEAKEFFEMGMQKVNTDRYSVHSKNIMLAYYQMFSSDHYPHQNLEMSLN